MAQTTLLTQIRRINAAVDQPCKKPTLLLDGGNTIVVGQNFPSLSCTSVINRNGETGLLDS